MASRGSALSKFRGSMSRVRTAGISLPKNEKMGLGKSLATGAAHAVISRWIASDGNITVISGSTFGKQEPKVVESVNEDEDDA